MLQTRRFVPALAVLLAVLGGVVWAQPAPKTATKPKLEDLDGDALAKLVKGFVENKANRTPSPSEMAVLNAQITFEHPKTFNYNKTDKTLTITRAKTAPAIDDNAKMIGAIRVVVQESLVQADAVADKLNFDPWWDKLKVTFKTEDGDMPPPPPPAPQDPIVTAPCPPTVTYSVVTTPAYMSNGCCLSFCGWGKKSSCFTTSCTVVTVCQPVHVSPSCGLAPCATTTAGCGTIAQAAPLQTYAPVVANHLAPVTTSIAPTRIVAASATPTPALEVVAVKRRPVVPKEELLRGKDREQATNLYSRGACCYWDGEYEQALAYLEAATTLNDKDARFWYFLALTQWQLNHAVAAREAAMIGAAVEFLSPTQQRTVRLSLERIQGTLRKQLQEANATITDEASATACLAKKSPVTTAAK